MQVMSEPDSSYPPATVLFAAMHNIVTAGVSDDWIPQERRAYYCPSILVEKLKAGIFSTDADVLGTDASVFTSIPSKLMQEKAAGIPGLALEHRLVNCTIA
mmetsp:Transcript_81604/g.141804  ORF Transcript_81604/g.141804 Transcript_81604/m.141804 type:complete len:101 (+) Transcript_81604:1078-1380(+)